jgi:hypothetical protein
MPDTLVDGDVPAKVREDVMVVLLVAKVRGLVSVSIGITVPTRSDTMNR